MRIRLAALLGALLLVAGAAAQPQPRLEPRLNPRLNPPAPEPARLLRYPHIQGDKIAFVHGGDIWTASSTGGNARRVTSFDEGLELFPRISPDGHWIAFSGEYSGTRQIYVVPFTGGQPRQVTFYPDVGPMPPRGGYDHLPLDWTPDGKHILIRANRTPYGQRVGRYLLVNPWGGGLGKLLQVPEGGPATLSPDGRKLCYNIISREWRTWKRYKAGRAQDVFIYDLDANKIERLTDFEGTDNFPMWLGDRIYFTSDRTGTLNLYAYDLKTKAIRPITAWTGFDVLFPSRGRGGIIFEAGGDLHVMDAATEKVRKLRITLADDRPWLRPVWKKAGAGFGSYAPSPSGKRVLVEFRGDLFSVPESKGAARNLTRSPGRRERDPRWSPDGRWQSFLAEVGDDYELFLRDAATGEERQLTTGSTAWILSHQWTAKSDSILFTDKANRLLVVDVKSAKTRVLDTGTEGPIRSARLSADGSHVAYVKQSPNSFSSVWLCALADPDPRRVSSDLYQDGTPAFDPKGRYLYFVSSRDYSHSGYTFTSRMYALLLQKDAAHPLAPQSDEEAAVAEAAAASGDAKAAKAAGGAKATGDAAKGAGSAQPETAPKPMRVDWSGLADRLVALPEPTGAYSGLAGVDGGLLFYRDGALRRYDLETRKSSTVLSGVTAYTLTPDRKRLFYRFGGKLCHGKPKAGQVAGTDSVPMTGVRVRVVPQQEWRQMYTDAWRLMRDWFYDPEMHAVDWRKMREKYQPLVNHASHRSDLDFLLGELIGELNCGHTYVTQGESPRVARVPIGLLGCEFEQVGPHYRISRIYAGENWEERTRSPLTEPGVDAKVGDYLLAIDGQPVRAPETPYHFLENTVGQPVTLSLNGKPEKDGARRVVVRPIRSELGLRHLAWVRRNRELVDRLSGGRIGYIHVPNTAIDGHRELFKGFRPMARVKQAMIIDDRYNGGGWVPDDMAQALGRPVLSYWARRGAQLSTTPRYAFEGPRAMLINGYSSSGGDAFPFYFRKLGLGKLIGKTTWGGLVGYSGTPRLVDGGGLAVPSFAFVNTAGEWDVEAVGVAPDIEVFDDPTLIQAGREPVLEAAVEHLLAELAKRPPAPRPAPPPGPKRDR